MSANERSGLKAAFTNFNRQGREAEAELRLLGRTVEDTSVSEISTQLPGSYQQDTAIPATEPAKFRVDPSPPCSTRSGSTAFVPLPDFARGRTPEESGL